MKKKIIHNLCHNRIVEKFIKSPCPRFVVFTMDVLIVILSCAIAYGINPALFSNGASQHSALWQAALVVAVYAAMMPVIKSYKYIVRLSVVEDMYRIVALVASATSVLLLIGMITLGTEGAPCCSVWNVCMVMFIAFTLLMCMRLAVKYMFRVIQSSRTGRTIAIALGSSVNSLTFATSLNADPNSKYRVVALLTLSPDINTTEINDLPVFQYNPDTIAEIFKEFECDNLIFPTGQMKFIREEAADQFLNQNIKLHVYTQVSDMSAQGSMGGDVRSIRIEDLLGREVIKPDTTQVEDVIRDQVVMITGAAGSIGSEIVNQIAELKASEIVLLDQAETPMHELQLHMEANHPGTKIHLFIADVANADRVKIAFEKYRPRYVFHAAAYKHVPMMERNPAEAIITNVLGTKNVADLAVKYDVDKFVMVSTDKAVNPTNVMGASKRIAEIYVQSLFYYNQKNTDRPVTRFITTRFGNVLGSNGSVIPLFRKQIEQGGPVTVTHRDIIRYFMTIPEACSLVLQAGTMGNGGEIYVFDMGKPVKIYDLATRMISLSGLRPGIDIRIVETGLRPGEKLYEELLNDKEATMATSNNKIMVAKVRRYDYAEVSKHIENLRGLTQTGNYHDIVAEMKRIVPEFHSKNSQWEQIDKEINDSEKMKEI